MKTTFRVIAALAFVAANADAAHAQWLLTPFAGVTAAGETGYFDPDDAARRSKLIAGASMARVWGRFGAEVEIASVPGFFTRGDDGLIASSGLLVMSGNAVMNLPRLGPIRPYALAGLGAVRASIEDVGNVFPVHEWQPAVTAGVGALVPFSGRVSLRADARFTATRRSDGAESSIGFGETYVDLWRLTAGLAIRVR